MEEKIFSWLIKKPKLVNLIIQISKLDKNVVWTHTKTVLIILAELYLILCILKTQI